MRSLLLIVCCLCGWLPGVAYGVSISEVAWMGDSTSANNEWIELYNDGGAVAVDGWQLTDGMNLTINLAGTIPANTYVLLERNRSSGAYLTVPPFVIYTGALVNSGAVLTLKRGDGSIVDQVAGGEGWVTIGGDNVTKETAQYTSAGWRTGTPTPGRVNTATGPVTPPPATPATTTTGSGGATTTIPTTLSPTPGSNTTSPKSSSGGARSETVKLVIPNVALRLALDVQGTAYVNQPIVMRVTPSGLGPSWLASLNYEWNFGDLGTSSLAAPIHRYAHPGTYMVTVRASYGRHEQVAMGQVTVLPVPISLAYTAGGIQLQNNAPYEVDVSRYRLSTESSSVLFPPRTIVAARSTITIPLGRVAGAYGTALALRDRAGEVVALWPTVVDTPVSPAEVVAVSSPVPQVAGVTTLNEVEELVSTDLVVESDAGPLVLLPPIENSLMPAYVLKALSEVDSSPRTSESPTHTFPWTYVALALLLVTAIGAVLATSKKMSLTQPEIMTFR